MNSFEATGINPPKMRWNRVEIVGFPGLDFGIYYDADGALVISLKKSEDKWPEGYVPDSRTISSLTKDAHVVSFKNDEREINEQDVLQSGDSSLPLRTDCV